MPRMMGVDIPGKKHIRFALRYIHGIGPKRADDVLAAVKVDPMKKADDVTQDEITTALRATSAARSPRTSAV